MWRKPKTFHELPLCFMPDEVFSKCKGEEDNKHCINCIYYKFYGDDKFLDSLRSVNHEN